MTDNLNVGYSVIKIFIPMKFLKIIVILSLLFSCKNNSEYSVKSFKINQGWGYDIALNNRIIIKQNVIPTLSNKKNFSSQADALKVGNLVLDRIKQNLSPTITKKDLILLEISI